MKYFRRERLQNNKMNNKGLTLMTKSKNYKRKSGHTFVVGQP